MADMNNERQRLANTLIYLVRCGVNGEQPEEARIENVDPEALYALARRHNLPALCCMVLEKTKVFAAWSEDVKQKWQEAKNKAIRKNMMLDAERNAICAYMEQAGIWYMPLKGIILKDYYPKFGMRQMADNDILYDAAYQEQLKTYMESRGYKAEAVGKSNHDVYKKKPVYNFEMHTALYGRAHQQSWEDYYRDVKERLIPEEGRSYGFRFREEDFYVYIVSHACKHFKGSGTGLRTLADLYVYLQAMEEKLDWTYIERELAVLDLTDFECRARQLCKKVFSPKSIGLTEDEEGLLAFYLGSGTYGTEKNRVRNQLRKIQPDEKKITKKTKNRYYLKRLIPDRNYYEYGVPILYKHKILIPFFIVYRILRAVFRDGKRILNEILVVHRTEK